MRRPGTGTTWLRRYGLQLLLVGLACCLTPQIDFGQPIVVNQTPPTLGPPEEPVEATPEVIEFEPTPMPPQIVLLFEAAPPPTFQALEFEPAPINVLVFEPRKVMPPVRSDPPPLSFPAFPTLPFPESREPPLFTKLLEDSRPWTVPYEQPLLVALDRPTFGDVIGVDPPRQAKRGADLVMWVSHPLTPAFPLTPPKFMGHASVVEDNEITIEVMPAEAPSQAMPRMTVIMPAVYPVAHFDYQATKRALAQKYAPRPPTSGWPLQPLLSAGTYLYDTFTAPIRRFAQPVRAYQAYPNTTMR